MNIEKTGTFDAARIEARTAFEKDVIYRRWNAEHGGVYAPVNEKTQPNPYLDVPERDIITPLGKKLTKINPAYMTRQAHEIAMQAYGAKGHITSLNPIRPANTPDFWETQALKGFQAGEEEVSSVEKMDGKYYMRLMRPLLTESGCLKCHAAQGYKLGDIRGGISVAVPMAPLQAIGRSHIITFSLVLGLLWLIGLAGIGFGALRLSQQIHNRIGVEETLRESEAQKRAILDGITTNLAFVNENLEIQWLNKACVDSVNKSPEEMIGRKCHEFWADPETPCDGCPTLKAFRTKKSEQTIMHTPDGRIWDEKGEPVFDESGRMIGVIEIAHDITDKAKTEEALRKSEESYRAVAEDTPVLICRFLPGGEITYVNDAYCKYFEKTQEELLGKNFQSFIPETDRETVMANLSSLTPDMPIQAHEHRVIAPDGGIHWQRWTSRALFSEQGQAVAYQAIGEDITERKRAEEALKESEEKYRSMMDAMTDPVYICSPGYKVVYMNPAMILRIGQDGTGEHCYRVINDLEERCPWCVFEKVQEGQKCETDIVSPKDNRFYHISHSPIFNDDGSISKLTIYRDITELKQTEEEKNKLQTQLQQSQKMEAIGTLAGGIAHDFNNILGAIIGYAGMMEMFDVPEDSPMRARIKEVLKAANRAKDLVAQILTFSRQTEQERKPVQLNYIVKEALKFLRASLPTTVEIRQNIANEEFIALADPTQIHQILMNLCTNAGHAMLETGGRLTVELSALDLDAQSAKRFPELKPGPHLNLTVSDTGHGMTSEIMERIFDPFFTTKKPGEGTGMGLAVVHGIVKSYEGMITVDSELGKDTTFQIILPRIEMGAVEAATKIAPAMPTGTERILFIDDEQSLATLVQEILGRLGYKVVTKTSSREALELFRSQPESFDLVITDQTMPHMTGIELALDMMRIRSDIPVILCTGHSEAATPERIEAAGIRKLINKPLDPYSLAQTIRKVLDNK